mmetsp:Transcript_78945/g.218453  ORF Transcript_78945/g.218453 Transcript_78945/m.218453 type:complete len:431 (+) Transcript_78945:200-1492(+)
MCLIAVLVPELVPVGILPELVVHGDLRHPSLVWHRGQHDLPRVNPEGIQDHRMLVLLQLLVATEPTAGNAGCLELLSDARQVAPKVLAEELRVDRVMAVRVCLPGNVRKWRQAPQQCAAVLLLPELHATFLVKVVDLLHKLLERCGPLHHERLVVVPGKLETFVGSHLDELEHDAQQACVQILARTGVVAHDRGIDIHENQKLLVWPGVAPDDVEEVILTTDGVEEVGLHQNVAILHAVVNDSVAVQVIPAEAVPTFAELDEFPSAGVPEVADALPTLRAVPLEVIVKKEHANRVVALACSHCRNHLGIAIGAPVLLPNGETGGGHVQARGLPADPVVELDVSPLQRLLMQVEVNEVNGRVQVRVFQRLDLCQGPHPNVRHPRLHASARGPTDLAHMLHQLPGAAIGQLARKGWGGTDAGGPPFKGGCPL